MCLSSIIIILASSYPHEGINTKGMHIIFIMANPIFPFLSYHLQIVLTRLPRQFVRWEQYKHCVIVDNTFCVLVYFCLDNIFRKVNQYGGCTKSIFRPTSRSILVLLESCLQTCMIYTIAECTVNKLLMMDRRTVRNM